MSAKRKFESVSDSSAADADATSSSNDDTTMHTSATATQDEPPALEYTLISALNANTDEAVLRARVIEKHERRTWDKALTGKGCFFNFDIMDDHPTLLTHDANGTMIPHTMIRVVAFNDQCNKFYDMMQPNAVYSFRGFRIKKKNGKFNPLPHAYEIHLEKEAEITLLSAPASTGTAVQLPGTKFCRLDEIKAMPLDSKFSTVVQVFAAEETIDYFKNGQRKFRRTFHLVDDSRYQVGMTVFGADKCNDTLFEPGKVLVLRNVGLDDFNKQRNIKVSHESRIVEANPDIPEAVPILNWLAETDESEREMPDYFIKVSTENVKRGVEKRLTCAQLNEMLANGGTAQWHALDAERAALQDLIASEPTLASRSIDLKVWALVKQVKYEADSPSTFLACPKCHRKVRREKTGYQCEKCNTYLMQAERAYRLSMWLYDDTGACEVIVFHDAAQAMLKGQTADSLWKRVSTGADDVQGDARRLVNLIHEELAYHEYLFTLRDNMDTQRNRLQLVVSRVLALPTSVASEQTEEKHSYAQLNSDL